MIFAWYFVAKHWFQNDYFSGFFFFFLLVQSVLYFLSQSIYAAHWLLCSREIPCETTLIYWAPLLSQNIQLHFRCESNFSCFQLRNREVACKDIERSGKRDDDVWSMLSHFHRYYDGQNKHSDTHLMWYACVWFIFSSHDFLLFLFFFFFFHF